MPLSARDMASEAIRPDLPARQPESVEDYAEWACAQMEARRSDGTSRDLGVIKPCVMRMLAEAGQALETPAITLTSKALAHLLRDAKHQGVKAISRSDVLRLPEIIANPLAILGDRQGTGRELLLIFKPQPHIEARLGQLIVRLRESVTMRIEGRKEKQITNLVVTAGLERRRALANPGRYQLLDGSLGMQADGRSPQPGGGPRPDDAHGYQGRTGQPT